MWTGKYLVITLLFCGLIVPGLVVCFYRLALRMIDAAPQLIARVYVLRGLGFELVMFPAMLVASLAPATPPGAGLWLSVTTTIITFAIGMTLLLISVWMEWRAQRQGSWRLRR